MPGIIFTAWFSLAAYVIVEEGAWGTAALRRSRELVRGRTWDVIGTMFLSSSLSVITIVPVLGTLAYLALTLVLTPVYAVRYVQLVELKKLPDWESTPTSPLNYLALAAGLIFTGVTYNNDFQKSLHDLQQNSSVEKSTQPY
ncbi:MAG TPA: hypothetical protein VMT30_04005 [Candidatus Saccharimonadia bacterium]|nr:hypothetical protein [Candidatus Saccharimonadia bacterium]